MFADAGYVAIAPSIFDRIEPNFDAAHDQDGIQKGIAAVSSGLAYALWEVDRYRYLKRLKRPNTDDWRYSAIDDVAQLVRWRSRSENHWYRAARIFLLRPTFGSRSRDHQGWGVSERILALGSDLIVPGSIVIDVGANIGLCLPWAACHSDVAVHCFEPHPQVRARLARNLRLNRSIVSRVEVHAEALSDHTGHATLQAVRQGGNLGLSALANSGILGVAHADLIEVPMIRLGAFIFRLVEGRSV